MSRGGNFYGWPRSSLEARNKAEVGWGCRLIRIARALTGFKKGCKAILALTESGSTALWMSRHNIKVPIYGLTSKVVSQRKMTLYRNVRPLFISVGNRVTLDEAVAWTLRAGRGFRLPQPTRLADMLVSQLRKN